MGNVRAHAAGFRREADGSPAAFVAHELFAPVHLGAGREGNDQKQDEESTDKFHGFYDTLLCCVVPRFAGWLPESCYAGVSIPVATAGRERR
jgi:hypothetical protein